MAWGLSSSLHACFLVKGITLPTVCVTALRAFEDDGVTAAQGEVIELPVVQAAILARKRLVSLDRIPATPSRRSHTYLRRDLVPEEP